MNMADSVTHYRLVGPEEPAPIRESGFCRFPICPGNNHYPVLSEWELSVVAITYRQPSYSVLRSEMPVETKRTIVPTREGYQRWAEVYDSDGNPLIALEEQYLPSMFPDVNGRLVADVGCGTGRQTLKLTERGAWVVALDFSPAMLDQAVVKNKCAQISFVLADIVTSIPLKSGVLDGAVCSLVLEHVEDLMPILRELRRVLKQHGFVLISDIHPVLASAGAAANFEDSKSGEKIFPRGYRHQLTDYVRAANDAGFRICAMTEARVDEEFVDAIPRAAKYPGWPMLLLLALVAC
jgi:malonyl-CoA O-methyltransferase